MRNDWIADVHDFGYEASFGFSVIWVEICNQSLFGHRPQRIFRAPVSKVKSNDPANRDKYIEEVLVQFEAQDIMLSFDTLK